MKKLSYLILGAALFVSCSNEVTEVAFRNTIEDMHPNSIIKKVDLHGLFNYQVTDTIKREVWIFSSNKDVLSIKGVCITCN